MLRTEETSNRLPDPSNHLTRSNRFAGRAIWGAVAIVLLAVTALQVQNHGVAGMPSDSHSCPTSVCSPVRRAVWKRPARSRAAPLYNALHRFGGPAILGGLAVAGLLPAVWLSAALGWGLHIAVDRAVGYGLRGEDGFQRA